MKYPKMNARLKVKWVRALRSGKYRQARLALREEGAYCCLGVLCRVADIPITKEGCGCSPRWLDSLPINDLIGELASDRCIVMNDSKCYSFAKIADWVEKHL